MVPLQHPPKLLATQHKGVCVYTVSVTAPSALVAVELGWEYADGYFPCKVELLKDARAVAKMAKERGGTDITITKDDESADVVVPIETPYFHNVTPSSTGRMSRDSV